MLTKRNKQERSRHKEKKEKKNVSCIVRSFVSCVVRSYFVSCVRVIKLTSETNNARNERYTKRTNQLHERNANERKTKNERTIHANETNEKRKRYEISANLYDPGSVLLNVVLNSKNQIKIKS